MPARVFFNMERQINRIQASDDLRNINVAVCTMGGEHVTEIQKTLIAEQGEVYIVATAALTYADSDALARLKELM